MLVSEETAKEWFKRGNPIRRDFEFFHKNELWGYRWKPKEKYGVCQYFQQAMIGRFILRPMFPFLKWINKINLWKLSDISLENVFQYVISMVLSIVFYLAILGLLGILLYACWQIFILNSLAFVIIMSAVSVIVCAICFKNEILTKIDETFIAAITKKKEPSGYVNHLISCIVDDLAVDKQSVHDYFKNIYEKNPELFGPHLTEYSSSFKYFLLHVNDKSRRFEKYDIEKFKKNMLEISPVFSEGIDDIKFSKVATIIMWFKIRKEKACPIFELE